MDKPDTRRLYQRAEKPGTHGIDGQTLAVEALTFLGSDPEQAQQFFALTGLDADSIRKAVTEPGFLSIVLDHLTADNALLERFARHAGRRPADIALEAQAIRERGSISGP